MNVYKTKEFSRFARRAALKDDWLLHAAGEIAGGRCNADLGGGVFKQRIGREGGGKSGGFRTIIVFKTGRHCFVVHGFAKSKVANVSPSS